MTVDPITRGWALVTSAGVVRLGLGFVASLVIARTLGPADFGVFAVLAATVAIVGTLAEGGLTEAAVLRIASGAAAEAQARSRAFLWLRVCVAAAVAGGTCLLAEPMAGNLLGGVDAGLLRWALLGIVATAASGALSAILQATGRFGRMSSLTVINTALTAALAVVLAALGRLDLLSALVVLGIGTSLVTFGAAAMMLPTGWRLALPSRQQLAYEAARLFHTGRWLWLASLFAMLTANAEVLLLNRWAALPLLGAYALALNLASKADVVNQSLYTVLLPGVAQARPSGYLRRGLLRSAAICVCLAVLIPLAEPVLVLLYGAEYRGAAPFLQLLLGIAILDVLLTPFLLLPLAYSLPKVLAGADAARAITLVVVAIALLPGFGPFGAIAARFAARVAGALAVGVALLVSGRGALQVQHTEAAAIAEKRPAAAAHVEPFQRLN
ncbi:MAG: oligosaccharide flippase family protein [Chloroflexi bacterium]|nr:oligosaccharide flippase family protein [Chloroflexota bacterium]